MTAQCLSSSRSGGLVVEAAKRRGCFIPSSFHLPVPAIRQNCRAGSQKNLAFRSQIESIGSLMQVGLPILTRDAASDGVLRCSRGWVRGCGRRVAQHSVTVVEWPASVADGISSVVFGSASGSRPSVRSLPRLPGWQSTQRRSLAGRPGGQPPRCRAGDALPVWPPACRLSPRGLPHGQPVKISALAALPCWQAARCPSLCRLPCWQAARCRSFGRLPAFRRLSCHETSILGRDQSLHRPALYLG